MYSKNRSDVGRPETCTCTQGQHVIAIMYIITYHKPWKENVLYVCPWRSYPSG